MTVPSRDKKNVLVLATCQMLFGSSRSLLIATAPLIAYTIAAHKGLATLPASLVIIGTALATVPASLFMRRVGRRMGFLTGTAIGAAGGVISVIAVAEANFWLFCLGILIYGCYAGFAQFYRFAAADVAVDAFKSRAISLVLAGGVVAAFVGPELAKLGQNLFATAEFLGAYIFLVTITLVSALVLALLDIPPLTETERAAERRPIRVIMTQPVFLAATLAAMMSQGVMNLVMTATPIAMKHVNHEFADMALVIEWHIVGMFAPGFVTGSLIRRFGETSIILTGVALQFVSILTALSGDGVFHFWFAMLTVGVGWNFAFTGGSSLLARAHTASERGKTQGAMNFLIFGFVAVGSLSSGALVHYLGWQWVNLSALPLLALAAAATMWFAWSDGRSKPVATA